MKTRIDEDYKLGKCGIPWLPYCGKDYDRSETNETKIYVCGKAGGSWGLRYVSVDAAAKP